MRYYTRVNAIRRRQATDDIAELIAPTRSQVRIGGAAEQVRRSGAPPSP
jgi:hypothetical protein